MPDSAAIASPHILTIEYSPRPRRRLRRVMGRGAIALTLLAGAAGLIVPRVTANPASPAVSASALDFLRSVHATTVTVDHHDHHLSGAAAGTVDPSQISPSVARPLAQQLSEARNVAARWPTAADAMAAGWTLAAPYESHLGTHYMHYADIDGTFDVEHPEMLLYDGDAATSRIVGLAYYVKYTEPSGFTGGFDHWHQHPDVCIGPSGPLLGADGVGICATTDTRPVGAFAWMLHVWVVPGYASPQGVFSTENVVLR